MEWSQIVQHIILSGRVQHAYYTQPKPVACMTTSANRLVPCRDGCLLQCIPVAGSHCSLIRVKLTQSCECDSCRAVPAKREATDTGPLLHQPQMGDVHSDVFLCLVSRDACTRLVQLPSFCMLMVVLPFDCQPAASLLVIQQSCPKGKTKLCSLAFIKRSHPAAS